MLMTRERRAAFRTNEGWARGILLEAGAIRECETHGWMQDRADPHARERALVIAREDPLIGLSPGHHVDVGSFAEIFVGRSATRWLRLHGRFVTELSQPACG